MAPKVLKCTVELEIQAVTCPGVVLMNKEDVYLSVCILGKYLKTKCLPPVFPMVFREKMIFHKVFGEAVDPGHVAELLELDTATFELIQLIPPVGETLAVLAENTREFLYPGPRLSPSYVGSNRDLLMKRAISFPGIAPKLEFSTFSAIEECSLQEGDAMMMRRVPPSKLETPKRTKKGPSEERRWARGYELPTVSSQSRSPSPYTRRRMCELSEESRERLAHLNLGPYRFKKETETHAPFVVRHVDDKQRSLMDDSQLSFRLSSPKSNLCHSWSSGFRVGEDSSLLGSYRPKTATVIRKPQETDSPNTSFDTFDEHISMSASRLMQSGRLASVHSAPSSVQKHPPSPLLHRSSLKERFEKVSSNTTSSDWEEIHDRVKNILRTHRSSRCLHFNDDEDSLQTTSCKDSLCESGLVGNSSRLFDDTMVHLGSGHFWSNQAARYKGVPHRAVFEESLEKIYGNLYKKASGST
ncbi:spermatogenesis-associated protein 6 isoform X2 [Erpetoichthys calabaricus]|uniref:Spermatogenesis associated 6 n=1 Tax=Erpetoichthys calabaricus TaxID=27687 RepID=A0A8C4X8U9_ERPCA|nr:spermatogenesis-associated protein 6 isoform X1 [Erpetoichthys calabaricus]XP_028668306.1 spermatogenesis-associated protein 6 isoform X1 [Erpetoichthys calabaricus]XP_051789121.1 spermatogenesis-associated protein 6 isoform X2 [Erpetoichthys calabaricus]XP_051789123.1 spermatogenesis-associated protein 6 isoform X3 [Erpetoichthys calabaricus]XP_051789124.1 spermatogenesis-associated protein 6 isoform X4 [Erpetoichthys calabaricus]XP_051789125.1 spermatogenesis-associated protein 6 isoform 